MTHSFLYDWLLPQGVKQNPLNREKHQEAVKIFSNEACEYLMEIRNKVVVADVVEKKNTATSEGRIESPKNSAEVREANVLASSTNIRNHLPHN